MSIDTALSVALTKRLAELQQNSYDIVITGRCTDFSEYRYSCGYVKGIQDALALMDDIKSTLQGPGT